MKPRSESEFPEVDENSTDSQLLHAYQVDLFRRKKETTASTYRTGPRMFVEWEGKGHESKCGISVQKCMGTEKRRRRCESHVLFDTESSDINRFIGDMKSQGYGHTTCRSYFYGIREFFKFATAGGLINESPVDEFVMGRDDPLTHHGISQTNTKKLQWTEDDDENDIVFLSAEQVEDVIENVSPRLSLPRNELLHRLLWQTGLRAVEASRLKWSDIDVKEDEYGERVIRVRSAKKHDEKVHPRFVSYRPNLDTLFAVWREEQPVVTHPETECVFSTELSAQMSPNAIGQLVRESMDRAGFDDSYEDMAGNDRHRDTTHILRSSYATFVANNVDEVSIVQLQYLLGHDNLSETMKYVNVDNSGAVDASRHGPQ